jgi:hypothetical protein
MLESSGKSRKVLTLSKGTQVTKVRIKNLGCNNNNI